MDYIEDTNLIEEIESLGVSVGGKDIFPDEAKQSVLRVIREQPTADVVEVVRCKNCKKWTDWHTCEEFTTDRLPTGGKMTFKTEPDDFCSYGERINNEN